MSDSENNGSVDSGSMQKEMSPPSATKPGAKLAALRDSHGWSVEQVASQLNLAPRQVRAIESDNYDALPGMAVTRGFMRAYAKLMRVDPVPLLALLPDHSPTGNAAALPRTGSFGASFNKVRRDSAGDRRGISAGWKIGALLALIAVTAVILERKGILAVPSEWTSSAGRGAEPGQTAGAAPDQNSAPEASAAPSPAEADNAAPAVPPSASGAPVTPGAQAASGVPGAAAVDADPAVVSKNALVLTFREDSWVEIKRADNRFVLSRLAKAGTTETVEIKQPVSVVIGNASGVDATWRGEPLALKSGATGNVARLNLK